MDTHKVNSLAKYNDEVSKRITKYTLSIPSIPDAATSSLIILDAQNDHMSMDESQDFKPYAEKVNENIAKLAVEWPGTVYAVKDLHPEGHVSFHRYPKHCTHTKGVQSPGATFIPKINEALKTRFENGHATKVLFKALSENMDSLGAVKYSKTFTARGRLAMKREIQKGYAKGQPSLRTPCVSVLTGSFELPLDDPNNPDSNVTKNSKAIQVLETASKCTTAKKVTSTGINKLYDLIKEGTGNVYVCGNSLSTGVLDTAVMVSVMFKRKSMERMVYIIANASRVSVLYQESVLPPSMFLLEIKDRGINLVTFEDEDLDPLPEPTFEGDALTPATQPNQTPMVTPEDQTAAAAERAAAAQAEAERAAAERAAAAQAAAAQVLEAAAAKAAAAKQDKYSQKVYPNHLKPSLLDFEDDLMENLLLSSFKINEDKKLWKWTTRQKAYNKDLLKYYEYIMHVIVLVVKDIWEDNVDTGIGLEPFKSALQTFTNNYDENNLEANILIINTMLESVQQLLRNSIPKEVLEMEAYFKKARKHLSDKSDISNGRLTNNTLGDIAAAPVLGDAETTQPSDVLETAKETLYKSRMLVDLANIYTAESIQVYKHHDEIIDKYNSAAVLLSQTTPAPSTTQAAPTTIQQLHEHVAGMSKEYDTMYSALTTLVQLKTPELFDLFQKDGNQIYSTLIQKDVGYIKSLQNNNIQHHQVPKRYNPQEENLIDLTPTNNRRSGTKDMQNNIKRGRVALDLSLFSGVDEMLVQKYTAMLHTYSFHADVPDVSLRNYYTNAIVRYSTTTHSESAFPKLLYLIGQDTDIPDGVDRAQLLAFFANYFFKEEADRNTYLNDLAESVDTADAKTKIQTILTNEEINTENANYILRCAKYYKYITSNGLTKIIIETDNNNNEAANLLIKRFEKEKMQQFNLASDDSINRYIEEQKNSNTTYFSEHMMNNGSDFYKSYENDMTRMVISQVLKGIHKYDKYGKVNEDLRAVLSVQYRLNQILNFDDPPTPQAANTIYLLGDDIVDPAISKFQKYIKMLNVNNADIPEYVKQDFFYKPDYQFARHVIYNLVNGKNATDTNGLGDEHVSLRAVSADFGEQIYQLAKGEDDIYDENRDQTAVASDIIYKYQSEVLGRLSSLGLDQNPQSALTTTLLQKIVTFPMLEIYDYDTRSHPVYVVNTELEMYKTQPIQDFYLPTVTDQTDLAVNQAVAIYLKKARVLYDELFTGTDSSPGGNDQKGTMTNIITEYNKTKPSLQDVVDNYKKILEAHASKTEGKTNEKRQNRLRMTNARSAQWVSRQSLDTPLRLESEGRKSVNNTVHEIPDSLDPSNTLVIAPVLLETYLDNNGQYKDSLGNGVEGVIAYPVLQTTDNTYNTLDSIDKYNRNLSPQQQAYAQSLIGVGPDSPSPSYEELLTQVTDNVLQKLLNNAIVDIKFLPRRTGEKWSTDAADETEGPEKVWLDGLKEKVTLNIVQVTESGKELSKTTDMVGTHVPQNKWSQYIEEMLLLGLRLVMYAMNNQPDDLFQQNISLIHLLCVADGLTRRNIPLMELVKQSNPSRDREPVPARPEGSLAIITSISNLDTTTRDTGHVVIVITGLLDYLFTGYVQVQQGEVFGYIHKRMINMSRNIPNESFFPLHILNRFLLSMSHKCFLGADVLFKQMLKPVADQLPESSVPSPSIFNYFVWNTSCQQYALPNGNFQPFKKGVDDPVYFLIMYEERYTGLMMHLTCTENSGEIPNYIDYYYSYGDAVYYMDQKLQKYSYLPPQSRDDQGWLTQLNNIQTFIGNIESLSILNDLTLEQKQQYLSVLQPNGVWLTGDTAVRDKLSTVAPSTQGGGASGAAASAGFLLAITLLASGLSSLVRGG